MKEQGRFALEHAHQTIDYFSEVFGVDYPLPKSDLLAVHDALAERLAECARELKVGNGLEDGVHLGPLIDAAAVEKLEQHLSDALAGDRTLFAREDYVEEAWRIVDPVVKSGTPIYPYEPGTWGPKEVATVTPPGGWFDPVAVPA